MRAGNGMRVLRGRRERQRGGARKWGGGWGGGTRTLTRSTAGMVRSHSSMRRWCRRGSHTYSPALAAGVKAAYAAAATATVRSVCTATAAGKAPGTRAGASLPSSGAGCWLTGVAAQAQRPSVLAARGCHGAWLTGSCGPDESRPQQQRLQTRVRAEQQGGTGRGVRPSVTRGVEQTHSRQFGRWEWGRGVVVGR